MFRAASRAHAETGAPICTHTTLGTRGLEQLEIFKSFGVDLSRVVLSHIDLSADLDYMKACWIRGSTLRSTPSASATTSPMSLVQTGSAAFVRKGTTRRSS